MQIRAKYSDWRENPISTNFAVRYSTRLPFPAVAICNINLFRLSHVADSLLPLLTALYANGTVDSGEFDYTEYEDILSRLGNISANEYLMRAAHQKEKMILKCTSPWGPCDATDFDILMTEYGICYVFNKNSTDNMTVRSAGQTYGLKLIMNAESYEIAPNPSKTSGFKVLIFNQSTTALVGYSGTDLSPGFLTQIGLTTVNRMGLPLEEGGSCLLSVDMNSTNYPQYDYSTQTCRLDMMTDRIQQDCQCTPFFAPTRHPGPVHTGHAHYNRCSMEDHLRCVIDKTVPPTEAGAICLDGCTSVTYRKDISFSALSTSVLRKSAQASALMDDFHVAKEAEARYVPEFVEIIEQMFSSVRDADSHMASLGAKPDQHYVPSFELMRNSLQCFRNLTITYPNLLNKISRSLNDQENENLPLHVYLAQLDRYKTLWQETCSVEEREQMKMDAAEYIDSAVTLAKTFRKFASIYSEERYQPEPDRVPYYDRVFEMFDSYENHQLTAYDVAVEITSDYPDFMTSIFTPKFVDPMDRNMKENILALLGQYNATVEFIRDLNLALNTDPDLIQAMELFERDRDTDLCTRNQSDGCDTPVECPLEDDSSEEEVSEEDGQSYRQLIEDVLSCLLATNETAHRQFSDRMHSYEQLYYAFGDMQSMSQIYLNPFIWGPETSFFRDNIAGVNIYYTDLAVEDLKQEKSYTFVSLACDIGGTMGLFLGASILTIFEILDLVCLFCMKRIKGSKSGSKKSSPVTDVTSIEFDVKKNTGRKRSMSLDQLAPLPPHFMG